MASKQTAAAALALMLALLPGARAVAANGVTVTATPAAINLCGGGNSSAISATTTFSGAVLNSGPTGFDASMISVSGLSGSGTTTENATATATGTKAGSTTLTFTDSKGHSGSAGLTVNDRLTASPSSLSFSGNSQPAQSFTVTNPCGGTIASVTYDTSAMTVTGCAPGTALSSTPVSCTVTPANSITNGTISVTDSFGGSASVSVTVSSGALVLSPASGSTLTTFVGSGTPIIASPASDTFTAQETSYTGAFSPAVTTTIGTSPVVSVSPSSANGPGPATFTVTPQNYGKGSVKITDSHGGSGTLNVVVSGGTVSINNSSISFNNVTDATSQFLAANNVTVMGSLMSVSSGSQIAVYSPSFTNAAIAGSHGGQLPLAALTYSCSGTINTNRNQGASFSSSKITFANNALASPCVTFPADSFSNLNFTLSVFLDDRDIPADTYSASGFLLVLSAN